MSQTVIRELQSRQNRENYPFVHLSGYKFIDISDEQVDIYRASFKKLAVDLEIKGTILLGNEGMNFFLSGTDQAVLAMAEHFESTGVFMDLPYKINFSKTQPYTRTLVRKKNEIVTMGVDEIQPSKKSAPYISAEQLKHWYDEGKDFIILDTRNDFEVALGKFDNAIDLDIKSFRDFPEAVKALGDDIKNKTVVSYCTGGIRCEKAAPYMLDAGFKDVYQLDGGIIRYFQTCDSEHYEGECFVFDKRVAIDANCDETETIQCFACRMPLPKSLQVEPVEKMDCPYCGAKPTMGKREAQKQGLPNYLG